MTNDETSSTNVVVGKEQTKALPAWGQPQETQDDIPPWDDRWIYDYQHSLYHPRSPRNTQYRPEDVESTGEGEICVKGFIEFYAGRHRGYN